MGVWAEIKYALNSTLGTSSFKPLNELLEDIAGGEVIFKESGVFTVPDGVTAIFVTACGGGGGGGSRKKSSSDEYGSGGGSGGACVVKKRFEVTPNQEVQITIGAGGAGGTYDQPTGNDGSPTIIGDLITLAGGQGGGVYYPGYSVGKGSGVGGYYDGSTIVSIKGENGAIGRGGTYTGNITLSGSGAAGGGGGGSYGDGAGVITGYSSGLDALPNTGGGGSGQPYTWGSSSKGGDGGSGIAIIEWGLMSR